MTGSAVAIWLFAGENLLCSEFLPGKLSRFCLQWKDISSVRMNLHLSVHLLLSETWIHRLNIVYPFLTPTALMLTALTIPFLSAPAFNPLSPHDALKHHFTSLKADLIFLQQRVSEQKFP